MLPECCLQANTSNYFTQFRQQQIWEQMAWPHLFLSALLYSCNIASLYICLKERYPHRSILHGSISRSRCAMSTSRGCPPRVVPPDQALTRRMLYVPRGLMLIWIINMQRSCNLTPQPYYRLYTKLMDLPECDFQCGYPS